LGEIPERERNFMRLLFADPRLRSLYPEWEELARAVVSYMRMEAARKPDDPRLAELVGDLSIRDAQFRQWWASTHVPSSAAERAGTTTPSSARSRSTGTRSPPTPSRTSSSSSTAEQGSRSERALRELAAWSDRHWAERRD
jgi:hypothetical protein